MPAIAHENKILGNTNNLNELSDVNLTSPQDGQVLTRRNGEWVNDDPQGGDTSNLIKWSEATTSVKKNLLPNKATSQTQSGMTYTVNADGTIKAVGTYTDTTPFLISKSTGDTEVSWIKPFEGKNVYISGSITNVSIEVNFYDASDTLIGSVKTGYLGGTGTGTIPSGIAKYQAYIVPISAGVTLDALFRPMIRLGTIGDSTYEPYILDNVELNELKADKTQITNPNLLDNPWFTVNQRRFATQTAQVGYTVDRWRQGAAYGTVTLDSDGCIALSNASGASNLTFIQNLPSELLTFLKGKTVTLSILFKDGTLVKNTAENLDFTQNAFYANVVLGTNSGVSLRSPGNNTAFIQLVLVPNDTIPTIRAVKLEVGEVSTLAMDVAPNYQQELAKCQRYYYRHRGAYEYVGYFNTSTNFRTNLTLPVPMRTIPSMKLPTPTDFAQCAIYDAQGNAVQPTAIAIDSVNNIVGQAELLINNTIPTHTVNMCGVQRFNLIMELSADL